MTAACKSWLDCVEVRELGRKPTLQACHGHDRREEGMFGRLLVHPVAACIASTPDWKGEKSLAKGKTWYSTDTIHA